MMVIYMSRREIEVRVKQASSDHTVAALTEEGHLVLRGDNKQLLAQSFERLLTDEVCVQELKEGFHGDRIVFLQINEPALHLYRWIALYMSHEAIM